MTTEPLLLSVTASRLPALLALLACCALGLAVVGLLAGRRLRAAPARRLLLVLGACLGLGGLCAAVRLAVPQVLLTATEAGLRSTLTGLPSSSSAEGPFAGGVFIPWRAIESIRLERVQEDDGTRVRPRDVLVLALRPGFEELRAAGVVVAPGMRRSTLDLPVPVPGQGASLLAELRALHQRFSVR